MGRNPRLGKMTGMAPARRPAWHDELRSRGYRLTPQRQLVLEAVSRLGHATPEDLSVEVRKTASGLNISTVYRSLELLEELGLVRHAHLGHGAPTYHLASDDDHIHLVCRDCGRVQEVRPTVMDDVVGRLSSEHGFVVDVSHFAVFGRCADCSAQLVTAGPSRLGS
jgi:Fur family transcriptional regulator, ferric uptake regulator